MLFGFAREECVERVEGLNQRGSYLEIWTNTNACDDLEDDEFRPVGIIIKVNKETEAEGHEEHPKPDWWSEFARFFDENSHTHSTSR